MSKPSPDTLLWQLSSNFDPLFNQYPLNELEGKRLFLTGGTGFIGLWLLIAIRWLNARGAGIKVTVLSRHPRRFQAKYPTFTDCNWLDWVMGDVKDYPWPDKPFDAIIHAATDTSPQAAASNTLFDDMSLGTHHVIDHAITKKIKRLLVLSSGAVYGEQPKQLYGIPEDYSPSPLQNYDNYARGKRAMEAIVRDAGERNGIETVIARCFSFIGFALPKHLAISQFLKDAWECGYVRLSSNGCACRSYMHAADLTVWLLALLYRGTPCGIYNVGSPKAMTLLEVATCIKNILVPSSTIQILGEDHNAPRQRYVPDTRKIERELDVKCWTPLDEAIRKMAAADRISRITAYH